MRQLWPWQTISWCSNLQLPWYNCPPIRLLQPQRSYHIRFLKSMLERMDSLNLFPHVQGGPLPSLLLDGDGSHFQLPFMRYIRDEEHTWKACIGVLNGTAHWQVGDSAKQNGSWKMATTRDKRKLSQFRISMGMPLNIRPSHIIPVCNTAWKQSFARVPSSKWAISRHGWQPLDRGLLRHPEVLKTKVSQTTTKTTTTTPPPSQEILQVEAITMPGSPTVLLDMTNTVTSSDMTNPSRCHQRRVSQKLST
jgi:hypothetical protein